MSIEIVYFNVLLIVTYFLVKFKKCFKNLDSSQLIIFQKQTITIIWEMQGSWNITNSRINQKAPVGEIRIKIVIFDHGYFKVATEMKTSYFFYLRTVWLPKNYMQ